MKNLLLIALMMVGISASAQVEGTWEEYTVGLNKSNKVEFLQTIEVVNVKGTWLLLGPNETSRFYERLDGMMVTDRNNHGEYYSFDENNELHTHDGSGQLDPEVIRLIKVE